MKSRASDKRRAQFLVPKPLFVAGAHFMRHARAAEERFKELQEAYYVLADVEKRELYDRHGEDWRVVQQGGQAPPHGWEGFGASGGPRRAGFDAADLDFGGFRAGAGGMGDIFEELLGRAAGGRSRRRGRGQHVEAELELSLEEAHRGGRRSLQMQAAEVCTGCRGAGIVGGNQVCQSCRGAGRERGVPMTVAGKGFDRERNGRASRPDRMEAVLEAPLILINEKKISSLRDILPLLETVAREAKPLLIIAENVEGEMAPSNARSQPTQRSRASQVALFLNEGCLSRGAAEAGRQTTG